MALTEQVEFRTESGVRDSDEALNHDQDQAAVIAPQIRKLDLELVVDTVRDNMGAISSAILIGGAVGFLFRRRFTLASNCLLALMLQQALFNQRENSESSGSKRRSKSDIELERYALKLQRGDYGKFEVIPFR